jgi:hypothetical protein
MFWVLFQNATVSGLSSLELQKVRCETSIQRAFTYVFLLLVDMPNLEPDVLFSERAGWIRDNVLEALLALVAIKADVE